MAYRLTVDYTYSTANSGNTARSNINTYLASMGRPETAGGSGSSVFVQIDGLTEAEAAQLSAGLTSRWAVGTRTAGKASVAKRPD